MVVHSHSLLTAVGFHGQTPNRSFVGLGQIDVAHQPDEYISISDLVQSDQILNRLVRHWTSSEIL